MDGSSNEKIIAELENRGRGRGIMKIKSIRAAFLFSISGSSKESVALNAEIKPEEDITEVVEDLRQKAIKAIGPTASKFHERRYQMRAECEQLENKLIKLRTEWEATAEFLRAQGIKPDAPSMPQFNNLLSAFNPQEETVVAEFEGDEDEDDYEAEDDD